MAKVVLRDKNGVKEFVLLGEVTIGRLPENAVAIFDPQISRKHARILAQDGQFVLEDLGSAAGTRVNGQPVTRHVLQDADQIQMGSAQLVFLADKPQASDDGLFEKTMVGNDPLFAPTLVGGAQQAAPPMMPPPPPAAAPAPASPPPPPVQPAPVVPPPPPAPAPSSSMAAKQTVPIRPPIILPSKRGVNKRKLVQLVAALIIFGGGGWWVFEMLTTTTMATVDWTSVETLYKGDRLTEVQSKLAQWNNLSLNSEDRKTLAVWQTRVQGKLEAREVEALIFEKGEFGEASRRALADGNRYPDLSKPFSDYARIALAATFILDTVSDTQKANEARAVADLEQLIQRCREAEDRFTESKAELERLPAVMKAHQTCVDRLATLQTRLKQNREAEQAWSDVKAARVVKNWAAEVEALTRLSVLPEEITGPLVAPARIDALLKNATVFQEGFAAYQQGNYETAIKLLSTVEAGDRHAELARELVVEMRATADYSAGVKLYRDGKCDEALKLLANAQTEKAIALRVRVQATMDGMSRIRALQQRKETDNLIAETRSFLGTMTTPEDAYYRRFAEEILKSTQRQRIEQLYAIIRDLVQQNRLGDAYQKSDELLKDPDVGLFPEVQAKIVEVRDSSLKTIQKEVGTWVQNAEQTWNQYKQNPIVSEERTVVDGVSASFRTKAALLKQAFGRIAQVQGVVQALPEDKAKPVLELYEQIRQEVLRQAEKVFAVRTQYSQLGNFERTRQADEMIVLLGDVPGNQYYRLIVKKE